MSELSDLIALVTAVAAVLAGRAAYMGNRARRRLAAAVARRSNGHGPGGAHGSAADAGGHGRPVRPGDDDRSDHQGRPPTGRVQRIGRQPGGTDGRHGRDGGAGDGWSAEPWLDAAMPGAGAGAGADDDVRRTDGTSADGSPRRGDGTTDDGRRPGGPAAGPSPTGEVIAGWRSPAGVAGIVLGGCAVALVAGVGLVLAAIVVLAVAAVGRRARDRAAERNQRRAQLPVALDRLASALHGGASVPAALAAAGDTVPPPLGPELAALGREADGGRAVAEVLDDWADRRDDPGTRLAATALVLAGSIGASPARAAHGVATTLRERAYLADERRSLAGQARLSGLVLSVAPIGFTVLVGAADAGTRHFLLHTAAGWACLTIGLALDAAGAWWMSVLTRGADR